MERKIAESELFEPAEQLALQPSLSERIWNDVLAEPETFNIQSFASGEPKCSSLPDIEMDVDCETGTVQTSSLPEIDETDTSVDNKPLAPIYGQGSLPISAEGSAKEVDLEIDVEPLLSDAVHATEAPLDLHYALLDVEQSIAALAAGIVADTCSFSEGQVNLLRNAIMLKVGCERRHAHHIATAGANGASTLRQAQAMSDARRTSERLDRIIAILSANSTNSAGVQPQ